MNKKDLEQVNDIIEGVERGTILDDKLIDPCEACDCCENCGDDCQCLECDCKNNS